MQIATSVLFACAAGTMLLFSSCKKDLIQQENEEVKSTPLPGETSYCRIESISQNAGMPNQTFRLILYDEFENPVAITTPVVSTGSPYRVFKYDQWHRLREYRSEYSRGSFETWHFYGYDLNGRIDVDTTYVFGIMGEKPENYHYKYISKIEYDNQDRINRVSNTDIFANTWESKYEYDNRGNLIEVGRVYNNQINIHRSNDIWMFLNRDYSMNSSYEAAEYNSAGFPSYINTTTRGFIGFFHTDINLNNSKISYSCWPAHY
jgi:hypothetical protein